MIYKDTLADTVIWVIALFSLPFLIWLLMAI